MTNSYYNHTSGQPVAQQRGASSNIRAEFDAIQAGFNLLPTPAQLYGANANYATDTGAANAYVITVNSAISALSDGMQFSFKVGTLNANTGASTLAVNGLTPVAITRNDGTALQAADLPASAIVTVAYNAASNRFQFPQAGARGLTGPTGYGVSPYQNVTGAATDTVVTLSTNPYITFASTAPGVSAKLEDARTLTNSGTMPRGVIKNSGSYQIGVRDNTGTLLTAINPGGVAFLGLESNLTQAGTWDVQGSGIGPILWLRSNVAISGGSTHVAVATIQLSSTLAVFITTNAGNIYGTAYDMSAGSLGTTTLILTGGIGTLATNGAMALDGTHGLLVGTSFMIAFSVSGLAITPGASVASTATVDSAAVLSASSFVVQSHTGTSYQARACTVSGVTITAGTATTVATAGTSALSMAKAAPLVRSATQVIALVQDTGGNKLICAHYTVSSTSVTADSTANVTNCLGSNNMTAPILNVAGEWWFFGVDGSGTWPFKLTVSGVTLTVTKGSAALAAATGAIPPFTQTQKINSTTFAFFQPTTIGDYVIGTISTCVKGNLFGNVAANSSSVAIGCASTNGSFINTYTGHIIVGTGSAYTLIHIDEAFTNTAVNPRASYSAGSVGYAPMLFRFSGRDIILGFSYDAGNVMPGIGLFIDQTSNQTPYQQFSIPQIAIDSTMISNAVYPGGQAISVTATKGAILGTGGRISSFEVSFL